jgi:hypothetical protein
VKAATTEQRPAVGSERLNFIVDVVKFYVQPYVCGECGALELLFWGGRNPERCFRQGCGGTMVLAGPRQRINVGINDQARRIRMEKDR